MAVKMPLGTPTSHMAVPRFTCWLFSQFQLPANVHPGRQHMMIHEISFLSPMWETRLSTRLLALAWPTTGCCSHLRSEPANERSVPLCLSNKMNKKSILLFVYFIMTSQYFRHLGMSYWPICFCWKLLFRDMPLCFATEVTVSWTDYLTEK